MRNKLSNLVWGILFIVVGAGIAGDVMRLWEFHPFFPGWWTLFIIVPCIISIIRNGFSVGSGIGILIGLMLLVPHYVDIDYNLWQLIVPAILILIGLKIIFQGAFRKTIHVNHVHVNGVEGQKSFHSTGRPEYSAIFSGNRINVTDQFTGANLNAVFGGLVLDLRDAIISGDVEITATAIFGGIDIYIPRGVQVKINNVPIFGGVSDKTARMADPNATKIYLNSTCVFGGIDIK